MTRFENKTRFDDATLLAVHPRPRSRIVRSRPISLTMTSEAASQIPVVLSRRASSLLRLSSLDAKSALLNLARANAWEVKFLHEGPAVASVGGGVTVTVGLGSGGTTELYTRDTTR